jgi:hypothetical protein
MAETSVKRGRGRPPKEPVATASIKAGTSPRRMAIRINKKVWVCLLVLLMLVAVGISGFFVWRYYDTKKQLDRLSNPQEAAKVETQQLIDKVGILVDLPKGETPTIATVQDLEKLKGQAFFADAQNGDKALIYTQSKKAFLYRPSTNKVINIAPLSIGSGESTPAPAQ